MPSKERYTEIKAKMEQDPAFAQQYRDTRAAAARAAYDEKLGPEAIAAREWRRSHPKEYAKAKRDARGPRKARKQKYTPASPARKLCRKRAQLKKQGWTLESIETAKVFQGNCCDLCKQPFTEERPPVTDHKHIDPPKPRGLLHSNCNTAIGLLNESPVICRAAAEYIERWETQ